LLQLELGTTPNQFSFLDCEINPDEDVHLTYTKDGRPSGEAFVVLHSEADFDKYVLSTANYTLPA